VQVDEVDGVEVDVVDFTNIMGSSISSLVRNTNAWLHAPATLRGGYVLAWGMTFGFQVWQTFIGGIVAFKTRQSLFLLC
jgi:hypothetical protein